MFHIDGLPSAVPQTGLPQARTRPARKEGRPRVLMRLVETPAGRLKRLVARPLAAGLVEVSV